MFDAPTIDDTMMSAQEVAEWLGVSRKWLIDKRAAGDGPPCVRLSERCWRYPRRAVEKWVESRMC